MRRAVNAVLVSADYDPPRGGMGRSMQWIRRVLEQMSYHVTVCAPGQPGYPAWGSSAAARTLFAAVLQFVLPAYLRRTQADVLLLPVGPGGVFCILRPHVRRMICVVYHTYHQQSQHVPMQRWKKLIVPLERHTLRMAEYVLCFSADTATNLEQIYGIDPARILLAPHAISTVATPSVPRNPLQCLCVARLEARKGVDVLLRAWGSVTRVHSDARLILVGTGAGQRRVNRLCKQLGGSVQRLSHVSQQQMQTLLVQSSIAVCPSYLEGFGLSVVEAMAAGCCVIASDAPGIRCLIRSGYDGVLVPAGAVDELSAALLHAYGHTADVQQLGRAAARSATRFAERSATSALADIVRRATQGDDVTETA